MKIKRNISRVAEGLPKKDMLPTLRDLDSGHIVNMLEENMRLRESTIDERIRDKLRIAKSKDLNNK